MDLKYLLDVHPHIEKALTFCGIAIAAFGVLPTLAYWAIKPMSWVIYGLLILAGFQLILFFESFFKKVY